ncbi:Dachshund homolog 2,Dachshund homolog 1 [Mytilus coruscus]|uniref:Dachshund homolog 2,Dachshund homolog 1 n=1 Tax=Mytilus coruscus TaxID=42192 RepID=A0A6J8CMX0_MYTCO|nr:Dachshund homolog 2,Dachshund homolog 1 [Mytilus coruscus]
MDPTLLHKVEHLRSPPQAHSSPGTTPGTISLAHGTMLPALNLNSSLMNKIHKTTSYSSPPPVANNPDNNVCKLIDYRGAKIAAFVVEGRELICLPQAFELFLKHLVGGLHTVYTKLKRLDITPVVCNVEQVRILRGLGAIQPGVNRCKLISCKEFDVLYEDCTNSSARPGRPPKRSPSIHASPDTLEKLKKSRLDTDFQYDPRLFADRKALFNGFAHHPYAMGPLPFMPFNNHMLSPPVSLAMASHLGLRPDGSMLKDRSGSESDVISPRIRDDRLDMLQKPMRSSPTYDVDNRASDYDNNRPLNLHINGHAKDLPQNKSDDELDEEDDRLSDEDRDDDLDNSNDESEALSENGEKTVTQQNNFTNPLLNGENASISSIETLLLNIQGLLKVAAENARHHERQLSYEKAELKMELLREREVREGVEKQLDEEKKSKGILIRRLKKERRARKRVQERLENPTTTEPVKAVQETVASPQSVKNFHGSDSTTERDTDKDSSNSDSESKHLTESQDRSSRPLFESFLSHASNPNRYPYLPMAKSTEVQ